jgi:hypothetical protein
MGEYARYNGQTVKIGTCNSMYYLRWDDRQEVTPIPGNVDPVNEPAGLFFRLPFPDEDHLEPGDTGTENFDRGIRLYRVAGETPYGQPIYEDFAPEDLEPGTVQLSHALGLLLNIPCYHGLKLPEIDGCRAFWNGHRTHLELVRVKETDQGLRPVVKCRACQKTWTFGWEEILPWVQDKKLLARLEKYAMLTEITQ